MKLFGRELVSPGEIEQMKEASADLRTLRRELEDLGWHLLNSQGKSIDIKPEQRDKMYRRLLNYYLTDPLVGASIDMLPTYIFGRGLSKAESSNKDVQEAIDEFWEDEDNKLALTTFQAQYFKAIELQLQANIYFVIFEQPGWGIRVGTIPHEEIVDIIPNPENRQKHLWYKREFVDEYYDFERGYMKEASHRKKVVWYQHWEHDLPRVNGSLYRPKPNPEENVYVETKGRILHMRQGGTSEMRFGVPSAQRILDWAKAHSEWMRSRVAISKAAAAFAWERKVKSGSDPNKVMAIARSWATAKRQPTALSGMPGEPGERDPAYAPRYASMLTTNEGVEYKFQGGNPTGAGDAASDQKMFRSMISAGTRLPQHMLGDEGSANLATATAMNEPVIRMMEFGQEQWEGLFRTLLDKHLEVRGLGQDKVSHSPQILLTQEARQRVEFLEANGNGNVDSTPGDLGIGDRPRPNVRIEGGVVLDPFDSPRESANKPVYKLAFPPILNRDVAAQMNIIIDVVTGLDPAGDNTDLTRWAFREVLKVMGEVEPDRIVDEIFPAHNLADQFDQNVNKGDEAPPGAPVGPGMGPADPALAPVGDVGATPALTDPRTRPGAAPSPGLGNDMLGTQNGARMGASLQEAGVQISDMQEFERIFSTIQERVLNPNGSDKQQRLLDKIDADLISA